MPRGVGVRVPLPAQRKADTLWDICLLLISKILKKTYYEDHTELDLNDFLDTLTGDQRTFMENVMLKDMFWTKKLPISEEEIETYVKLIKEANLKRRLEFINEKIAREEQITEALIKEKHQIIVLLNHTK